jgi:hypothetical protein
LLDQPVLQEVVDAALSDRLSGEEDALFRVLDIWSDVPFLGSMISRSNRVAKRQAGMGIRVSRLGLMFWLTRNRLSGSHLSFSVTSLAYFSAP